MDKTLALCLPSFLTFSQKQWNSLVARLRQRRIETFEVEIEHDKSDGGASLGVLFFAVFGVKGLPAVLIHETNTGGRAEADIKEKGR